MINTAKPSIGLIGLKGFPAFGGSARAGENLVEMLKDKYDFTIFNVASHTRRETGKYDGYHQIVFRKFLFKRLNTLAYYIKTTWYCLFKAKFDLILVYHLDAAFIIPILMLKYKVISGIRAQPQKLAKWNALVKVYFKIMEFIFFRIPAHVITSVSRYYVEEYRNKSRRNIIYIPNGILFRNLKKQYPKINHSNYLLFSAGRIVRAKGCHLLLEAAHKLNYQGQIIVIGGLFHSRKYVPVLRKLSKGLNVKFIPLIKDKDLLMAYIRNAKLCIFPSALEGMSNMLLEYASMKTPVICSNIPENTIVFDHTEALHFKTQNSLDLADKLDWALQHPIEMQNLADRAYEKLQTTYNWDLLANDYNRIFQLLLSTKKSKIKNLDASVAFV